MSPQATGPSGGQSYTGRRSLRGGVIGSTPDSGSGSWGSSPCPAVASARLEPAHPLQRPTPARYGGRRLLLTITTTHRPATDLGFLLHKHPERAQAFSLGFGTAHVLYPEASP